MSEKLVPATLLLAMLATSCTEPPEGGGATDGGSGGGGGGYVTDAGADAGDPPTPRPCEGPPGLYQDDDCEVLADGVASYTPRFPLWTDGAQKERYISLPPGSRIDASDPDNWIFPVGTRLWKTFIVAGKRVETRVLEKVEAGDGIAAWDYVSYAWDETQRATTPVPQGVVNALGTTLDIPSTSDCEQCHAPAAADMVLGFSAIQLNHGLTPLSLDAMNTGGWFADGQTIPTSDADVPGDATEQAALGYLHGNCGHCHDDGLVSAPAGLRMRLSVGDTTVEGTQTYLTAVDQLATWVDLASPAPMAVDRIEPGFPEQSAIWMRLSNGEMPPLGTEIVDPQGVAAVGAFITALGAN